METMLEQLRTHLRLVNHLESAARLLAWDQCTYMPPGSAATRGQQIGTLGRLAHEKLTDPAVGRLLDALQPHAENLPYDTDEASLIRVARRLYEQAIKIPSSFAAQLFEHASATYQAWAEARPANDFARVRPYLEETLDLSRQYAGFFPGCEHIADPLIDRGDYGLSTSTIRALFTALRERLLPLVQAITSQPPADDACLHEVFPEPLQLAFGIEVARQIGYDFDRGRLDKTHHPFTTYFSIGDVRITTRFREDDLGDALFSTIHEAGHALYEQGIRVDLEGTPLARGTSSSVHESQSRLWENLVGRSLPFWQFFYPRLQAVFPAQLGNVPLETFYHAINRVQRSAIRVDADEVTYNLHVLLRFDLEVQLLEGELAVRDLPEAWRARMEGDLGFSPQDDRDGVLQDVHWYNDTIGGRFQGYTMGNILSAQLFEAARQAHPQIVDEMKEGEFGTLRTWLREKVWQHGRKFTTTELVERITGGPLNIEPYLRYLRTKYGALHEL